MSVHLQIWSIWDSTAAMQLCSLPAAQNQLGTVIFLVKVLCVLVNSYCVVGPLLAVEMGAEWKQGHWMHTICYHVVGSDAGCRRCLITVGPTLGPKLLSQVSPHFFLLFFVETSLVAWAQRIKDTNTLDVVRDDYLCGSSNVWIQHRNIDSQERGIYGQEIGLIKKRTLW